MIPESKRVNSPALRNVLQFLSFSVALISILLFSYMNIYSLPLGPIGVDRAIEYSDDLSERDISIFGELYYVNEYEFLLIDLSSKNTIESVWFGETNLPLNGTFVIAQGRFDGSTEGLIFLSDKISPRSEEIALYDNPWAMPVIRIFSVAFFWFLLMITITGITSFFLQFRRNISLRNYVRAFTEVSLFSGILMLLLLGLLIISEARNFSQIGVSSWAAIIAMALLILSISLRRIRAQIMVELGDSLPLIACLILIFGASFALLEIQAIDRDSLIVAAFEELVNHPFALIIGTAGFLALGFYLASRKYAIIGASKSVFQIRSEVNED